MDEEQEHLLNYTLEATNKEFNNIKEMLRNLENIVDDNRPFMSEFVYQDLEAHIAFMQSHIEKILHSDIHPPHETKTFKEILETFM